MKRFILAMGTLAALQFASCKNEPKTAAQPTGSETEQLTAEQREADAKQAVTIDSMTKSLESLETNIKQATEELDKAINELPE